MPFEMVVFDPSLLDLRQIESASSEVEARIPMWQDSAISEITGFRSASAVPRLQPDPAVLAGITRTLRESWRRSSSWGVPDDYARILTADLLECLRRLDALPREDPFWEGTNRRPTQGAMGKFLMDQFAAGNVDADALRMAAAYEYLIAQSFPPPTWSGLLRAGVRDASWPVYAALNGYDGGYDTVAPLAELLRGVGAAGPARSALERLRGSATAWVAEWVVKVESEGSGLRDPVTAGLSTNGTDEGVTVSGFGS
jgi:hypothetical protein